MIGIVLVFLLAPFSDAYKLEYGESDHNLHWSSINFPVTYRITIAPPVPFSAFEQAVGESFAAWQAVKNATITFQASGTTDKKEPAYDGENCIIMGNNVSGPDVVGQAYIFYSVDTGEIFDVDIMLNSSYPWATDGSPKKMDVQDTLTHEVGHLCGLDDLYGKEDREKTMYGYIDYGETKKRTLEPDDEAGLAAIYPVTSSGGNGGGGGGSGCGTVTPASPSAGSGSINFLWIFLLLTFLGIRRLLFHPQGR